MKKTTGIVDRPLSKNEDDKLQIQAFEKALIEFISNTSTPISIALQGEWGSGKTSLMNRVASKLCDQEESEFYGVWLNTWQFSLLNDNQNILISIIKYLIDSVLDISKNEYPEKLKYLIEDVYKVGKSIFKGISRVAVKAAASQINESTGNTVDELLFADSSSKISNIVDLRNKFSNLVQALIEKNIQIDNKKRAFLFFIDDLDRIEPEIAVKTLELLKNIFDIDNCVFVLAIDYEVVVKGLKSKFGELNSKNEREFRSFFDKIIQLPFQMPIHSYIVNSFIKDMLISVNFIEEDKVSDEFINQVSTFINLSVGNNPRSIKRLTNTVSFVNLLIKHKNKSEELNETEKQIIFALTCIQIAYPQVFNLLESNPNLDNWNETFIRKFVPKQKNIEDLPVFDEKWKIYLFQFCSTSEYLKRNFFQIINIISEMNNIVEKQQKTLNLVLPKIITLLSVTNVCSIKTNNMEINTIRAMHALNQRLLPILKSKISAPFLDVERKGNMIAKLTYNFETEDKNVQVFVTIWSEFNNIYIKAGLDFTLFEQKEMKPDSLSNITNRGQLEVFNQLIADYNELNLKYENFNFENKPQNGLYIKGKNQKHKQFFQYATDSLDNIYSKLFLDELSNLIIDLSILKRNVFFK